MSKIAFLGVLLLCVASCSRTVEDDELKINVIRLSDDFAELFGIDDVAVFLVEYRYHLVGEVTKNRKDLWMFFSGRGYSVKVKNEVRSSINSNYHIVECGEGADKTVHQLNRSVLNDFWKGVSP